VCGADCRCGADCKCGAACCKTLKGDVKLTYFDLFGLGEASRLVLAAGGVKFQDVRYPFSNAVVPEAVWTKGNTGKNWGPDAKAEMPYGSIPVLEHNGVKIAQSHAIARYVATNCGLMGATPLEAALIDATEETIRDVLDGWNPLGRLPEAEKKPAQAKFLSELGHKLAPLEKQLRANKKGSGFLVGDSLSLADVYFYRFTEMLNHNDKAAVDQHMPVLLQALVARVENSPRIAAYLKNRENKPF